MHQKSGFSFSRLLIIVALTFAPLGIQGAGASAASTSSLRALESSVRAADSSKVVIVGDPVVKQALTAHESIAGSVRFQWKRNGASIQGATKSTYVLTSSDVGKLISVQVTSSSGNTFTSASVRILNVFSQAPKPTVSGVSRAGSTLTVVTGGWSPSPDAFKYQWFADGKAISGATGGSFQVTMNELSKSMSVRVTASKPGYDSTSVTVSMPGVPLGPSQLGTNQVLYSGQYLSSANGQFKLLMQPGGNLVENDASGKAIWATNKSGQGNRLVMQDDGNLVLRSSDGTPIWDTQTFQSGPNNYLILQDDGNIVVKLASGSPQWTRYTTLSGVVLPKGGTQAMSDASLSSTQNGTYVYNRRLWVVCYKYGQNVLGVSGWSTLWHQVVDGSYVADSDFLTGVDGPMAGEPACSDGGGDAPGMNGWAFPIRPHSKLTTYPGHGGDDFPVGVGTPVYSMGAGPVNFNTYPVDAKWCPVPSAVGGQQTDLQVTSVRDGHTYVITYAHLNSFAVSSGQVVQQGQLIGYSGSKGCATGPHLHVDIRKDGKAMVLFPRDIFGTSY